VNIFNPILLESYFLFFGSLGMLKSFYPPLFSWISLVSFLSASPTSCPQFYVEGEAPAIVNEKLSLKTTEICFEAFGVMHSGISKTPLWSAELLTKENIDADVPRKNKFHEEKRLPVNERAELKDYAKSGFDRGHMSPSADMPTPSSQEESFSLANMVPQDHHNNTGIWSNIESATRYLAKKEGSLYIITGPIFKGESLKTIGNGVFIPTMIYKIIYSPKQNKAAVYLTNNIADNNYQIISVQELETLSGINFFPKMSTEQKAQLLSLPEPKNIKH
jgi:endonuclease G